MDLRTSDSCNKECFFDEFDDGLNCQADSSDNEREYLAFGSDLCLR